MDERKPSIPLSKFHLRSASGSTSAVIYPPSAGLGEISSLERQTRCGQIEPSRSDFSDGSAVAIYYRNEREVSRGFLIALGVMGVAQVELSPEPPKSPGGAPAQNLNDPVLNGAAPSVEKSGSPKES